MTFLKKSHPFLRQTRIIFQFGINSDLGNSFSILNICYELWGERINCQRKKEHFFILKQKQKNLLGLG